MNHLLKRVSFTRNDIVIKGLTQRNFRRNNASYFLTIWRALQPTCNKNNKMYKDRQEKNYQEDNNYDKNIEKETRVKTSYKIIFRSISFISVFQGVLHFFTGILKRHFSHCPKSTFQVISFISTIKHILHLVQF